MGAENQSFLSQVANELWKNYKNSFHELCIVMPSNRGIIHLKQYLHEQIGETFIVPDFFSIELFMQKISGLSIIPQEELLIHLYKINQTLQILHKQEFYDFIGDAQILLQDFNDIDLNLVEPKDVFSDLSSIKELSFFGKTEEQLSESQRLYLLFYQRLLPLYEQLKNELINKKTAYQGLIYRCAYENRQELITHFLYKKYIFVGFNALQRAEWGIVDYLMKENLADFYVDADTWYLEDPMQEAGMFLRKLKTDLNIKDWKCVNNNISTLFKNVQIIGFPQRHLQTLHISKILQEMSVYNDKKTAIVLADESLLMPLLHAVDLSSANITMGVSIRYTQLYQLLYHYFITIENISGLNNASHLYYKDLYVFFSSPYIQRILEDFSLDANLFLTQFVKKGKLYFKREDIELLCYHFPKNLFDFLLSLFDQEIDAEKTVRNLQHLLQLIDQTQISDIDKKVIALLLEHIDYLTTIFNQISKNVKSYRFLFDLFVSTLSLSFKSNPMSSLQVMGMLETRTLDFDNVIILSVNEGVLPSGKKMQSFIPYDVKKHYNIPTYSQGEAIFSYHFYRLLQRAKNVYLLYDLDNQKGNAERSRFIHQIVSEWSVYPNIAITESILSYPKINLSENIPIEINKTDDVLQSMQQIRSFSASMLNRYLECGLKFYLYDVLRISEPETITEEIQANVIGSVIHKILESVLKDRKFNTIKIPYQELEEIVMNVFLDQNVTKMDLRKEDILYEKNHLIFKITIKYINDYFDFLEKELQQQNIQILDYEKVIETSLLLDDSKINQTVRLKGIIDRLDIKQEIITVLDYKTGNVETSDLHIKTIEDLFTGENAIAFQLMFYAYLYYSATRQSPLKAQVVSFKNKQKIIPLQIDKQDTITPEILDDFAKRLQNLILEINNPSLLFTQTTISKHCQWCDYATLCKREKLSI